ncbi:MAG: ATP-binding protein [Clostridia bacterium]|nr:ATP-binding protein [Clostridia bacterium]
MRARILIFSLIITIISIILFSLASTQVYYNSSVDETEEYLLVYMNLYDENDYTADQDGADALAEILDGARVTYITADGTVLGDSRQQNISENHSDRPEVIAALEDGSGYAVRNSETLGENMVYYCKAFTEADGSTLLVRIAVSIPSEWKLFVKTLPTTATYIAIDIVLCIILAFVATYFIVKPVQDLAANASKKGMVTTKYSELKPIAEVLNERNRNIERQMGEIVAEKESVNNARKTKDEFISNITHEMNTPLTSIQGYAELLKAGALTEEQKQDAYEVISTQSTRLTSLITCIINYSEIDSDEILPDEVNFSEIAREMISVLRPEAESHDVTLEDSIEDNVIVQSRHELVCEVFGNLVRNAIRYNKPGGSVTVTLNYDCLKVADTGVGIAPENRDRIFDRFFTVDKSHGGKNGGFGLGLASVRKICLKYGWKISVESEQGKGSTFTVEF